VAVNSADCHFTFVGKLHFAYKINPLRFVEEAKLVLDQQAVNNIVSKIGEVGSQSAEYTSTYSTTRYTSRFGDCISKVDIRLLQS
jgi:hypothetical protein